MNNAYYLFSKTNQLESIYICEDNNSIDKPKYKTGIYKMGILLSIAVRILKPWYKENFNPFLQYEKLREGLHSTSVCKESFSSIANEDSIIQNIFEALIDGQHYIHSNKSSDVFFKLLEGYMDYITFCQSETGNSSNVALEIIANKYDYHIPSPKIFTSMDIDSDKLSNTDVRKLFSQKDFRVKQLDIETHSQSKKLFDLKEDQSELNSNEKMLTPIYVYKINDIVDFISVSLRCIFEEKYFVGECTYCKELYTAKNHKIKYCPQQDNIKSSCQIQAKAKRQTIRDNATDSRRMHNSLRNMRLTKYGVESEEYRTYLAESQNWRNKVKNFEANEEEYVAWLKSQYKRKYK